MRTIRGKVLWLSTAVLLSLFAERHYELSRVRLYNSVVDIVVNTITFGLLITISLSPILVAVLVMSLPLLFEDDRRRSIAIWIAPIILLVLFALLRNFRFPKGFMAL